MLRMRPVPDLDRVEGTLIGQCLGDALGFAVEGYPPEHCASYVDRVLRSGKAEPVGRPPFAFGQYTDDSQLARELLASLVAGRGFDPVDYARRVAALFSDGRVVGRGRATEEAAMRLARGWPWWNAGVPPPAAGNGGAMRAAPAGLWHWNNLRQAASVAYVQSALTHLDHRACGGAVAIAVGTALSLNSDRAKALQPVAFCAEIAEHVRRLHRPFAAAIDHLGQRIATTTPPEALVHINAAADDCGAVDQGGWHGISPFVVPSVLWSLYSFLRSPDDPWETLCTAIAVGGDVDTTAAMAGALSGARCGLRALPARLTGRLTDRGTWRCDELRALAAEAHALMSARVAPIG